MNNQFEKNSIGVKDSQINPGIEKKDYSLDEKDCCGANSAVNFYDDPSYPKECPGEWCCDSGDETRVIEKEDKDPWKHRSAGMKCSSCMFFVEKESSSGVSVRIGRCRRNAPTMSGYPVVFPTDWCGEHKMDEEKLLCG